MWRFLTGIPRALRQQIQNNARQRPACVEDECRNRETEDPIVCDRHSSETFSCRPSQNAGNGGRKSEEHGAEQEKFNWSRLNTDFWSHVNQGRHCALEAVGWGAAVVLGIHLSKLSHHKGDLAELTKGKNICCTLLYKVAFTSPGQDDMSTKKTVLPDRKVYKNKDLSHAADKTPEEGGNPLDLVFNEFEDLCKKYTATGNTIAGLQHAAKNNMPAAVEHWKEASQLGSSKAQFNLGLCYESGIGVEKNLSAAIKQYKLAGNSDHAEALYNLALIYLNKEDRTESETKKAVRWMEKSAELGLRQAQTYMGVYHTECEQQDFTKAVSYFKAAANQKDPEAEFFLGMCHEQGWGIEQSDCKAAEYYKNSYASGHEGAMYNLGVFYEFGLGGVELNVEKAMELYEKSAQAGNENALHNLNRLQALDATAEWKRQEFAVAMTEPSVKDTQHLKSPASSPSLTEYLREHLDQLGFGSTQSYIPWINVDGLDKGRQLYTSELANQTPIFTLGNKSEQRSRTDFLDTGQSSTMIFQGSKGLPRPASLFDLQVTCN